jgi:alkylated DNA repair dioxygenase AlkB
MEYTSDTITLTFGEQAENHAGMEILGQGVADEGFTIQDLEWMKERFEAELKGCTIFHLDQISGVENTPEAAILIVSGGLDCLLGGYTADDLYAEQKSFNWDTKAKMRGRVVNKRARYNVCFGDQSRGPDYDNGKGTIIGYDQAPLTAIVKRNLVDFIGPKSEGLQCEGNYYYDVNKCYISFHGDSERKRVIGIRLGAPMPLRYLWFQNSKPVGDYANVVLNHGDLYVMSEKATGFDWKKRKIMTLRHAAGCEKYITYKEK